MRACEGLRLCHVVFNTISFCITGNLLLSVFPTGWDGKERLQIGIIFKKMLARKWARLWGWEEPYGSILLKVQGCLRCFCISSGTGKSSLWEPDFLISLWYFILPILSKFWGGRSLMALRGIFLVKAAQKLQWLLQGWSSSTSISDSHKYISWRCGLVTTNENLNYMYRTNAQPRNFQRKCIYNIWPHTDVQMDTHICIFCFCVSETPKMWCFNVLKMWRPMYLNSFRNQI